MKKILILSEINSAHTEKWVKGLISRNFSVYVYSFGAPRLNWFDSIPNFQLDYLGVTSDNKRQYFKGISPINKIIKKFQPDFIHAHYASSYGLIGALTKKKNTPFYVSVWGTDVFQFPKSNFITKNIFQYVMKKADKIFSTGNVMANEIKKYTHKDVQVISFGIDLKKFPTIQKEDHKELTIGFIKSIEKIYGIDLLIKALPNVIKAVPNIRLRIVGDGSIKSQMKELVKELQLIEYVNFIGRVPYERIPNEFQQLDLYVNPSRFESFGVTVLEASACGIPVIASYVGGLTEVLKENETGLFFQSEDIEGLSKAIIKLLQDETLRNKMKINGRNFVEKNYSFKHSLEQQVSHYV